MHGAELVRRLERHPELMEQVVGMLDEVENSSGRLRTVDDAEDAVVERLRKMGQVALTTWARRESDSVGASLPAGARRSGKKNSGG